MKSWRIVLLTVSSVACSGSTEPGSDPGKDGGGGSSGGGTLDAGRESSTAEMARPDSGAPKDEKDSGSSGGGLGTGGSSAAGGAIGLGGGGSAGGAGGTLQASAGGFGERDAAVDAPACVPHRTAVGFVCCDGKTIPLTWICDGVAECSNGADESGCPDAGPSGGAGGASRPDAGSGGSAGTGGVVEVEAGLGGSPGTGGAPPIGGNAAGGDNGTGGNAAGGAGGSSSVGGAGGQAGTPNLLPDGTFESGSGAWTCAGKTSCTVRSFAHSGEHSLHAIGMTYDGGAARNVLAFVVPGHVYQVSAWAAFVETNCPSVYILTSYTCNGVSMTLLGGSGQPVYFNPLTELSVGDWQQWKQASAVLDLTGCTTVEKAEIRIRAPSGDIYIDDVTITE